MILPKHPLKTEENWRRFPVENLFLPDSEIHNVDGAVVGTPTQFKIHSEFISKEKFKFELNKFCGFNSNFIHENHKNPTYLLKIHASEAILFQMIEETNSSHNENLKLYARESNCLPILSESMTGQALADRLTACLTQELCIETAGVEKITLFVQVNGDLNLHQSYSRINLTVASQHHVDLVVLEGHGNFFSHHRFQIHLHKDAQLRSLWVNPFSGDIKHLERAVVLESDARFTDVQLFAAGFKTRVSSYVLLNGKNAHSSSACAIVTKDQTQLDFEPIQEHKSAKSFADLKVKMLLQGRSRAAFQGLIKISKDAPGCKSTQLNKNLLLSKRARVDATPRLEIEPDDVACKHGSATGEIDLKQVYYLETRGFSEEEAKKIITQSFVADVLAPLNSDESFSELATTFLRSLENEVQVL